MGAFYSRPGPVLQKCSKGGENDRIKYGASSMQGWSENMEDAYAAVPDLDDLTSFFGVYDGHGHGGVDVALLCATQFHTELKNHPDYQSNLDNAMESTFFRMDELLENSDDWTRLIPHGRSRIKHLFPRACICAKNLLFTQASTYIPPQEVGSSACVVGIRDNQIFVGNVGHSRCIVSKNGRAIELSTDHRPDNQLEKERIEKAGGRVSRDKFLIRSTEGEVLEQRLDVARINGILAQSRIIGAFAFKGNEELPPEEQMATCDPECRTMVLTSDVEFLLIISDGIGRYLTSQDMVDYVRFYLKHRLSDLRDPRLICERLCDRALPVGSKDNVTVILIQFKHPSASRLPPPAPVRLGDRRPLPESEENKDGDPGTSQTQPLLGRS